MLLTRLALKDILIKENIKIPSETIRENNAIIVPRQFDQEEYIDSFAITVIKKMKAEVEKLYIAKRKDQLKYADFRGGEYEYPLILMKEVVAPVVLGIISAWIYEKIREYRKAKKSDPKNPLIREPRVKVRGYIIDSEKYFEIEGSATEAVKDISATFLKERD